MFVRLILFTLAFCSVCLFLSCHKQSTVYIKRIHNKSQKTLRFHFYGALNPLTYGDSITVYPGELKEIFYYNQSNNFSPRTPTCHVYNDSMQVVVMEGGALRKQLTNGGDWQSIYRANNRICTFEVNNEDID